MQVMNWEDASGHIRYSSFPFGLKTSFEVELELLSLELASKSRV